MRVTFIRNFIFSLFMAVTAASAAHAQQRGCFGTVQSLAGTVEYQTRKSESWQEATLGLCMFEGYGLRTASREGALIVLDDLSEIRISEETEMYFVDVTERFLMSRLSGISLLSGEIFMEMSEGYDQIMLETTSAAVLVQSAAVDIMIRPEATENTGGATGTSVFVAEGSVHVFDVYLTHRVTVGEGQQTNVIRAKPPQSVFFFNKERFERYTGLWRSKLVAGKQIDNLYLETALPDLRSDMMGCPGGYYGKGLWCCPVSCRQSPSKYPPDIYCPDGTYFIGNRQCCDNECRTK